MANEPRAFLRKLTWSFSPPASDAGVSICADPISPDLLALKPGARTAALTRSAQRLTSLLRFDVAGDDGSGVMAVLDRLLGELLERGESPNLRSISHAISGVKESGYASLVEPKVLKTAKRRLARLDVGARRLLFHQGLPLDVNTLLKTGRPEGKTPVSVIYLNSLHDADDKDFLVAALADRLYSWMLQNPSATPQLLFYIDEVSPFVPPVKKPAAKEGLSLLFKQARKYGVCCLMATQNPGDVDYRAMAQFGTWALGRLSTRQDLKKIEPSVKGVAPESSDSIMAELPGLRPGQFVLLNPDHFEGPVGLNTRWLLSDHRTLDEDQIRRVADERWRQRYPLNSVTESELDRLATEKAELAPTADVSLSADAEAPLASVPSQPRSEPPAEPSAPIRLAISRDALAVAKPEPIRGCEVAKTMAMTSAVAVASPPTPQFPPDEAAILRVLRHGNAESVKDVAAQVPFGEKKARRLLSALRERGTLRSFKRGRSECYWFPASGGRPDLQMPTRVYRVVPAVDYMLAVELGRKLARQKLLGLVGENEELYEARLIHRVLYKLDFHERVERSVIFRVMGSKTDERLGSVYLHPHSGDLLTFDPRRGITFHQLPEARASEVSDLDGVARFEEQPPGALDIDEQDWLNRMTANQAIQSFAQRFAATAANLTPVFFPIWRLTFASGRQQHYRLLLLDALLGAPLEWAASRA